MFSYKIFPYRVRRRDMEKFCKRIWFSTVARQSFHQQRFNFVPTYRNTYSRLWFRSDEDSDRGLLRGNEKASGSWTMREKGRRVGKGSDYTGGWKRGSDPRVHVAGSSGLVTYLPTYERLKAFHSRLYFRPVNRVFRYRSRTYETAATVACRAKRRTLLSLFLFESSVRISVCRASRRERVRAHEIHAWYFRIPVVALTQ